MRGSLKVKTALNPEAVGSRCKLSAQTSPIVVLGGTFTKKGIRQSWAALLRVLFIFIKLSQNHKLEAPNDNTEYVDSSKLDKRTFCKQRLAPFCPFLEQQQRQGLGSTFSSATPPSPSNNWIFILLPAITHSQILVFNISPLQLRWLPALLLLSTLQSGLITPFYCDTFLVVGIDK